MGPAFEYRVLGPVAVVRDGAAVPITSAKLRTLLAMLLLDANRVVPAERLISRLWEDDPPANTRAALHSIVARLRRLLTEKPGAEGDPIVTRPDGYLLMVSEQALDLHRFTTLVRKAQASTAAGRLEAAVDAYDEALAQWQGEPLGDVSCASLRGEVGGALGERRLAAVEERIELLLGLARHHEALAELAQLTSVHPLRERFWEQHMLALYRSGRQSDALSAYRDVAALLADELGIDPGEGLRDLHRRILAADPSLPAARPAVSARRASTLTTPAQLPAAPRLFTARHAELSWLSRTLASDGGRRDHGGIAVIGGAGGVGKTWLALHWAHQHIDLFPDGQLYADLRGFAPGGPPAAPQKILGGFLVALGVSADAIPADVDGAAGLYRSLVAGKRMLVFLDDAHDSAHAVPLLPGAATCTVIITSRRQLGEAITRYGASPLGLGVLTETEARDLLARQIGAERLAAEPAAAAYLVEQCAGLPLALRIIAAHAALRPDVPLAALELELRETSTHLDALDTGEPGASVRAVFAASYRSLKPAAARAFRLIGRAPGPDISLAAAGRLLDLPTDGTRALLQELEAVHLITRRDAGRLRMHDLVRRFAAEQMTPPERHDVSRLIDYYIGLAHAAEKLLHPHRLRIELHPATKSDFVDGFRHVDEAMTWMDAEHDCLLAAQAWAAAEGVHTAAWQLAWDQDTYHYRRGNVQDALSVWRTAASSAEHVDEPTIICRTHRRLAEVLTNVGSPQDALNHARRALALSDGLDSPTEHAAAHFSLALVFEQLEDYTSALKHARQALSAYWHIDASSLWTARSLNMVGWYEGRLGLFAEAIASCTQALELSRENGFSDCEASTEDSLGYLSLRAGHGEDAIRHYTRALDLRRSLSSTRPIAQTLDHLAQAHAELDDPDAARDCWRQALELYQQQSRAQDAERVQAQLDSLPADTGHRRGDGDGAG